MTLATASTSLSSDGEQTRTIVEYRAWDLPVRLCHWTIVLAFLFLSLTGSMILFEQYMAVAGKIK